MVGPGPCVLLTPPLHDGLIAEMENIITVQKHDQTWCHAAVNLREIQAKSLKFILGLQGE
jgi:hypothetical protein